MNCVCGYENKSGEWDAENLQLFPETNEDKFLKIEGKFLTCPEKIYEHEKKVSLVMCPKCGTIKGNVL